MGPLALLTAGHQTGVTQNLHVVGEPRLGQIHGLQQDAGTLFPAAQLLQNGQALGVAQGLEHLCVFLVGIHVITLHQNILMCRV